MHRFSTTTRSASRNAPRHLAHGGGDRRPRGPGRRPRGRPVPRRRRSPRRTPSRQHVGPGRRHDRHAVGQAEAERDDGAGGHGRGSDGSTAIGSSTAARYRLEQSRPRRILGRTGSPGLHGAERHGLPAPVAVGLVLPRRVWAHLGEADRAVTELRNVLAHQAADGFVPHMTYWDDADAARRLLGPAATSSITQPPMYGHTVAELARRGVAVPAALVSVPAGLRLLLAPVAAARRRRRCSSCTRGSPAATTAPGGTRGARRRGPPTRWKQRKGELVEALRFDGRTDRRSAATVRGGVGRLRRAGRVQRPFELAPAHRDDDPRATPVRDRCVADRADAGRPRARGPTVRVGPARSRPVRTLDALLPLLGRAADEPTVDDRVRAVAMTPPAFGGACGPAQRASRRAGLRSGGLLARPGLAPAHLPAVGRGRHVGGAPRCRWRRSPIGSAAGASVGLRRVLAPRHRRRSGRRPPVVDRARRRGAPTLIGPAGRRRSCAVTAGTLAARVARDVGGVVATGRSWADRGCRRDESGARRRVGRGAPRCRERRASRRRDAGAARRGARDSARSPPAPAGSWRRARLARPDSDGGRGRGSRMRSRPGRCDRRRRRRRRRGQRLGDARPRSAGPREVGSRVRARWLRGSGITSTIDHSAASAPWGSRSAGGSAGGRGGRDAGDASIAFFDLENMGADGRSASTTAGADGPTSRVPTRTIGGPSRVRWRADPVDPRRTAACHEVGPSGPVDYGRRHVRACVYEVRRRRRPAHDQPTRAAQRAVVDGGRRPAARVAEIKADPDARVLVLTGAGDKAFCAGADLGGMADGAGYLDLHDGRGELAALFARPVGRSASRPSPGCGASRSPAGWAWPCRATWWSPPTTPSSARPRSTSACGRT